MENITLEELLRVSKNSSNKDFIENLELLDSLQWNILKKYIHKTKISASDFWWALDSKNLHSNEDLKVGSRDNGVFLLKFLLRFKRNVLIDVLPPSIYYVPIFTEYDLSEFKSWLNQYKVLCLNCNSTHDVLISTINSLELSDENQLARKGSPVHFKTHDLYRCGCGHNFSFPEKVFVEEFLKYKYLHK